MTTFNSKKLVPAIAVRAALEAYRAVGGGFIEAQIDAMIAIFDLDECADDPSLDEAVAYRDDMARAHNRFATFMTEHAMRSIEGTWAGGSFDPSYYGGSMESIVSDCFPDENIMAEEWRDYAAGQRENAYVDARSGK